MIYDGIIIGAGAAGLMSLVSASKKSKLLILEGNQHPGLKILASGGGRCNFTNLNVAPENYVSSNPHFCRSALKQFSQHDFLKIVKTFKIPFFEKTPGQLFCKNSSRDILNLLLSYLENSNYHLKTNVSITSVQKKADGLFSVATKEGEFFSKKLIVATGGLSYPDLGASDLGYRIAKQFGHDIRDLQPALDGFVFDKKEKEIFDALSGVSLCASLQINKEKITEEILFTHQGLSGPASLKASLFWNHQEKIIADFLPHIKDMKMWFAEKRRAHPQKLMYSMLSQKIPARFAWVMVACCGLENKKMGQLSSPDMQAMIAHLKEYKFIPQSTMGYQKAEVTRGGVSTEHISSKTMESCLVPGLYFVGEVLDVTGTLGGYNLQWAWSSGWVAGRQL